MVGLGNPGSEYAGSRHNVGFRIVDAYARWRNASLAEARFLGHFARAKLSTERPKSEAPSPLAPVDAAASGVADEVEVGLLQPQTFMNRSGGSVAEAVRALGLADLRSELVVAYDDLDLPFGRLRIRPSGGAGGHRGLADVIETLGTRDFARLRFGIGRPATGQDTIEYVLSPFSEDEEIRLPVLTRAAAEALEFLLSAGPTAAMNRFNADPSAPSE